MPITARMVQADPVVSPGDLLTATRGLRAVNPVPNGLRLSGGGCAQPSMGEVAGVTTWHNPVPAWAGRAPMRAVRPDQIATAVAS